MKIKIFKSRNHDTLATTINKWFDDEKGITIIDRSFETTSTDSYTYMVVVIWYSEKEF